MALIKCHECGTDVSTEAKACPKCGAKAKESIGVGTILLVCVLTIVVLSMTVGGYSENDPAIALPDEAASACRTAINVVLNDPDSAQFDLPTGATLNADGSWTAQRTLRAKNAFGSYRRAVYECKLRRNVDGTWRGLDVAQISP